ncbi:MAG: hypothetical protein JRI80_18265 [Deltaproteobacteria bacterium]|nr:hypothetical protein [Deltaproteobacteria bacterium]
MGVTDRPFLHGDNMPDFNNRLSGALEAEDQFLIKEIVTRAIKEMRNLDYD